MGSAGNIFLAKHAFPVGFHPISPSKTSNCSKQNLKYANNNPGFFNSVCNHIYICQQFCTGQETQKLWMFLIGPRFSLARKQPTLRSTGRSCWSGKIAYGFFMFFPLKPIYGEEPKYWFCACVCVLTPSSILKFFFANCFTIHIYIYWYSSCLIV